MLGKVHSTYQVQRNSALQSPKFGAILTHPVEDATKISFPEAEVDKYLSRREKKDLRDAGYLGIDCWVTDEHKEQLEAELQEKQGIIDSYRATKAERDVFESDIKARKQHVKNLKGQKTNLNRQAEIDAQQTEIEASEGQVNLRNRYLKDNKKQFKQAMSDIYRAFYDLVMPVRPQRGFVLQVESRRGQFSFTFNA